MTLGGLAVAIGELVDDSIVDIENIYRRLKENRQKTKPGQSAEGDLSGLGRGAQQHRLRHADRRAGGLAAVLAWRAWKGGCSPRWGLAYMVTLLASLVVSLTVTPVLASYLLPQCPFLEPCRRSRDSCRWLKRLDRACCSSRCGMHGRAGRRRRCWSLIAVATIFGMGGEFLPAFNEGTLTIGANSAAGTSLEESDRIGRGSKSSLLGNPGSHACLAAHRPGRTGRTRRERQLLGNRRRLL